MPTTRQFAEMFSREHIARRLKAASSVPPEIRDLMLRALERDFPPKYRKLLAAYFASFIKPEEGSNVLSGDEEPSE